MFQRPQESGPYMQVVVMFHCQVRVDLTGDDTQKVFDRVLTNLARTAPPVPGFRRQKGGNSPLMFPCHRWINSNLLT